MEITRELVKVFRAELDAALQEVAKKHGLTVAPVRSISFDSTSFQTRVKFFGSASAVPDKKKEARSNFASLAPMFGLKASDLDKSFEMQGSAFIIAGINERAHKNNIVIKSARGKEYVTSAETVLRCLGRKVASAEKAPWE